MITKCEDCDKQTKVTLVGYGASYMAEINCPDCGVSYDTNLSEEEINGLKTQDYCGDCGQVEWLCICKPEQLSWCNQCGTKIITSNITCEKCNDEFCGACCKWDNSPLCGDHLVPLDDCSCKP